MKIIYKLCCIIILLAVYNHGFAQKATDYTLDISKINQSEANLHIVCSFTIDFQARDSLSMRFGGNNTFSIDNLDIPEDSLFKYQYNPASQTIVFHKTKNKVVPVKMAYDYTNLSAFFIYGEGRAEIWETSFNEYYYPCIPNTCIDLHLNIEVPASLETICSYPIETISSTQYHCDLNRVLSQSLNFAFIQKNAYIHTIEEIPYRMDIYQISGMQCNKARYDELLELTQASVSYFSEIYGDSYLSAPRRISSYPIFLFHDGKGFSNRYNIGFISASQEKFSTYPNIYPLVHEIGHRWLGEWTLLIDDGEPGAYFIKESLNEFMTLMFLRHYYGEKLYRSLIEKYAQEYLQIKDTPQDEPFINIVENNNNIIVYNKGPLVLDWIAQEIGYENLTKTISQFYRENAGKYPLRYSDLIKLLNKTYPDKKALFEKYL
ncbi:M1 family aminopeptidase [uncultured Alistipes sp.]|uniref:M1 family aminopeptidase n=1 Tax=uncultured Alistipes sp. TaxID=538949 RepID=UPI00260214DA|nr:M1 family aminopeptidase [uncultured Alistipes sp.]